MNKRYSRLLFWMDVAGGLLALNLAFILAVSLRFDDLKVENPTYYNYYVQLLVFFNLLWLLLRLWRKGEEEVQPDAGLRRMMGRNLSLILAHVLAFSLLALALKGTFFSRLFGLYFYLIWLILASLWSLVNHNLQKRWVRKGKGRRRVAFMGHANYLTKALANHEAWQIAGIDIVSIFCESLLPPGPWKQLGLHEAESKLEAQGIDEVYLASEDAEELLHWERLADQLSIRVRLLPDLRLPGERSFQLDYIGHVPIFYPRLEPLELAHNRWLKRAFDLVICVLAFVLIYPWVFPLMAILIKIGSKGPVVYAQKRSGWRNESFTILKFRSMDAQGNLTRVGQFIRKHSLDELPQFINVWKGEMSVVGPRPHMLEHTSDYRKRLDSFMLRHLIAPGLTGLAQVQGHRGTIENEKDLEARVAADVYYMEHWSLLLDLKIVGLTFFQLFFPADRAR